LATRRCKEQYDFLDEPQWERLEFYEITMLNRSGIVASKDRFAVILKVFAIAALALVTTIDVFSQNAPPPVISRDHKAGSSLRIELIGDSTQTDNAGYGRGFCANLSADVDCVNLAKGGTSTKTFRRDGIWDKALASKPDYMLIQFGHNDEVSGEPNDRQVPLEGYQQNLRKFVLEARAQKISPILVTPLTRRNWGKDGKIHSDLTAYANGMAAVAQEMKVPLIDLQSRSIAYLDSIGQEKGTDLGITKKDRSGKTIWDATHLNWQGSFIFGRMVAEDLGKAAPELAQYVLPKPAPLPLEGELAMKVIRGGKFKIVLVGDSTVATQGGWGPGFCTTLTPNVTCVDLGLNGRSTKSYIDEGTWKKALAEDGQYYFIQFGHNDQKAIPALHADAKTDYENNLRRMVREVRASDGIPILVSPLSRRNYRDEALSKDDGLQEYADAAREVAAEDRVTFVDLYGMSQQLLSRMTQEQADDFDMTNHPDAKAESTSTAAPDRTHLNEKGKAIFGRLIADNVIRSEVELGPNVIGLPEGSGPVLPKQAASTDGR
jgi:lysophospholipase L1-like esterase